METILRSDMMREINTGRAFTMGLVMCDTRRRRAGKIKRVTNWVKMKAGEKEQLHPSRSNITREVNHWENKTFIIYNPNRTSEHPITVHYKFVGEFNGKRVING